MAAGIDKRAGAAAARVAVFPLPFQGHISPMLQLAGALHARGLAVTVLHTAFNAPDPTRHPGFSFVAVPDAVPATVPSNGIAKILALNAVMEASGHVRDALASLMAEEDEKPRLACLVIDSTLTAAQKAAAGLGLSTLVLHTGSAACFRLFRSYDMLHDKGYLPSTESNLHLPVKELPPLQVRDLFDPSKLPNKEIGQKILDLATQTTTNSSGAIINTFEALEAHELEMIGHELQTIGIPAFAGVLERGMIERAIRKLMEEDEGAKVRERAKTLKEKAQLCLESSGSSQVAVDKLLGSSISQAKILRHFLSGEAAKAGQERLRRRVVLFPLPFQGHLSPMLQLAALLHERGLAVTVLHTDFNAPDPARHPELGFVPIHEAFPGADIVTQLLALNAATEAPFRAALTRLLRDGDDVACAVVDGQCYAALRASAELTLRTDSAATFRSMLAFPRLCDDGYDVPIKGKSTEFCSQINPVEDRLDELVPGLEPLRVRDLIRVDGSNTDALCDFIARVADAVRSSASGVVINTFEAIEASELAKIHRELSLPAFAVGPLHLLSPAAAAEQCLHAPDHSCLAWLDAHSLRSVLYVCLGSVACVMFEEMAWGMACSGVPFLWVVRPGSVHGIGEEVLPPLPDGVDEEIRNRGKIVAWAGLPREKSWRTQPLVRSGRIPAGTRR
ncbi:hypothetical protein EJB05_13374, partial [Eragrostis curvula]